MCLTSTCNKVEKNNFQNIGAIFEHPVCVGGRGRVNKYHFKNGSWMYFFLYHLNFGAGVGDELTQ